MINFEEWLDNIEEKSPKEMNSLYESINRKTRVGSFICREKDEKLSVSNNENDQVLILASEKAMKAFLNKLDKEYGGSFGSVNENWNFIDSLGNM